MASEGSQKIEKWTQPASSCAPQPPLRTLLLTRVPQKPSPLTHTTRTSRTPSPQFPKVPFSPSPHLPLSSPNRIRPWNSTPTFPMPSAEIQHRHITDQSWSWQKCMSFYIFLSFRNYRGASNFLLFQKIIRLIEIMTYLNPFFATERSKNNNNSDTRWSKIFRCN